MSTDKLQALSNTVAEILSKPPSPPTYFDEEPHDAAQASEPVAKASDNLLPGRETPTESFGKLTSRKFGVSPNESEANAARATGRESVDIARQALADQIPATPQGDSGNQLLKQLSKLSQETASLRPDPHTTSRNTFGTADAGNRISSLRGSTLRGFAVILIAAGIGVAAVIWLGSSGDAAKTVPSQPAATIPTAGVSPELTSLLQSISRDLASARKEIEQFKTGREAMVRDNANLSEQLKASQEQLTRTVARLSDQLKASQELATRDNAVAADQIRTIQDQLIRLEHNAPPRIVAAPPRLPAAAASPRPAPSAASKPVPTPSSSQAATQPKPEKPKPSSTSPTSRPPAPAR